MDARLEVSVGANISALSGGLLQASKDVSNFVVGANGELLKFDKSIVVLERQLKSFQNGLRNATDATRISTLNSAIDLTKSKLDATNKAVNGVGLNKLTTGSNQAAFALTNLGRVAQDAPFGFIGIQNNLNPLLESFQRLRAESTSNIGALKLLGQSLIGPAGIGIALSLITAAITFATVGFDAYTRGFKKTKEATQEYKDALTGLNKTQFDAVSSSGEEISRLNTLFRATQNLSLSLKDRQLAVNELQRQYPNYFANLTIENSLTEKSIGNYNKLKKEIVATALARAADKDTAKQGELIFENLAKRAEILKQINKLNLDNQRLSKIDVVKERNAVGVSYATSQNIKQIATLTEETKKYDLALKNANTTIFNNSQLQDAIVRKFGVQSILPDAKNQSSNTSSEVKARIKITPVIIAEDNGKAITEAVKPLVQKLGDQFLKDPLVISVPLDFSLVGADITGKESLSTNLFFLLKDLEEFNQKASEIISGGISNTFAGLGQAIGGSLADGTNILSALGSTLLSSFGDIAIQLGTLAIGTGIAIEAIKKALKSLQGPIAIGAGVALVALGSFVKGQAANIAGGGGQQGGYQIPKFANGVSNFGGGMAMVGERGRELVSLPGGSNVITNENIKRYGNRSSNPIVFIADSVTKGNDIVTSYRRSVKKEGKII